MVQKQLPKQQSLTSRLWHNAWSDVWGILIAAGGIVSSSVSYMGHIVNNPSVQDSLSKLSLPVWVGLAIAVLGAITWVSAEH